MNAARGIQTMTKKAGLILMMVLLSVSSAGAYVLVEENPVTADGLVLSIKHYVNAGAQPVVLQHGVVQNSNCWDLAVPGHSFAIYLADLGYDVWVPSFRNHGQDGFVSDPHPGYLNTIDDFAVYDVPAIIDYVIDATGMKPLWVGHSMGGMTLYAYLQGVEYQYVKVDNAWDWSCFCYVDTYDWRVGRNATLSADRNANKLAGVVTVNSPTRMKWKYDVSLMNFYLYNFWDYNLLVQTLASMESVRMAISSLDPVPLEDIIDFVTSDIRDLPYVGDTLADLLTWTFSNVAASYMGSQFWNPDNMSLELVDAVINDTLDNTSSKVLLQFMDCVNAKNFQAFDYQDPKHTPYVYSNNYGDVKVPILVLSSGKDKMACNDTVYTDGYLKIGSTQKSYQDFANFGHDDACMGLDAPTVVYPTIENWLQLHASSTSTARMN